MKAPRKPAIAKPPAGKAYVRWGDTGPWQEFERRRHKPLTNDELLEVLNQHIPADDLPLVQLKLAELIQKAQAPDTTDEPARGPGRPLGGLGFEVHELMTGPFAFDQKTARNLVAVRHCNCYRRKDLGMNWRCQCGSKTRVGEAHRDWLRDQKKKDPGETP
jgi:hypothetical protein